MRVALLFALANVSLAACLFPSFDDFHESTRGTSGPGAGTSTSTSSAPSGSASSGGGGATTSTSGGGGAGAGQPRDGGSNVDASDPCYDADAPIAVWPFDDGTGKIAKECSGRYDGTLDGLATWTTGRDGGSAILFKSVMGPDGGAGSVFAPSKIGLVLGGHAGQAAAPFSVAAWFDSADAGRFDYPHFIVSRHAWNFFVSGNTRYDAGFDDWGVRVAMRFKNEADIFTKEVFAVHGWMHVAVTFDGTSRLTFYVDGKKADAPALDPAMYTTTNEPMVIGSDGSSGFGFEGAIATIRVYDYELRADQVKTLATH